MQIPTTALRACLFGGMILAMCAGLSTVFWFYSDGGSGFLWKQANSSLVFFVLSPALVGSNLAKYITLRSLPELWFMPLNVLMTFVIGSVLGWLLVKIAKAPKGLRGVIMGCCAAGNLGNMLLVIVLAVCKEKGSPFGVSDVCTGNGMAYVSLSMAIGSIYIWSYVYNIIVRIYSCKDSDEAKPDVLPEGAESAGERNESAKSRTGPPLPSEDPSLGESQHLQLAKVPFPENVKRSFLKFIKKPSIRRLFAPAIIGAIVGLMIGIIPPFRKVLIGDSAPLHAVEDSADMVGKAAIPIMTLILGANLLKGKRDCSIFVSQLACLLSLVALLKAWNNYRGRNRGPGAQGISKMSMILKWLLSLFFALVVNALVSAPNLH